MNDLCQYIKHNITYLEAKRINDILAWQMKGSLLVQSSMVSISQNFDSKNVSALPACSATQSLPGPYTVQFKNNNISKHFPLYTQYIKYFTGLCVCSFNFCFTMSQHVIPQAFKIWWHTRVLVFSLEYTAKCLHALPISFTVFTKPTTS